MQTEAEAAVSRLPAYIPFSLLRESGPASSRRNLCRACLWKSQTGQVGGSVPRVYRLQTQAPRAGRITGVKEERWGVKGRQSPPLAICFPLFDCNMGKERQDGVTGARGEALFLVHVVSSPAQGQPGCVDLIVTLCEFRTTHAGRHPPPSGKTLCF